mmetsp:Transcript_79414/g.230571  ORF Transcript_79414/g.230571 Transcript_79414/m.230571 type:complete len:276 (-) Transcript_79414:393-1220(-)
MRPVHLRQWPLDGHLLHGVVGASRGLVEVNLRLRGPPHKSDVLAALADQRADLGSRQIACDHVLQLEGALRERRQAPRQTHEQGLVVLLRRRHAEPTVMPVAVSSAAATPAAATPAPAPAPPALAAAATVVIAASVLVVAVGAAMAAVGRAVTAAEVADGGPFLEGLRVGFRLHAVVEAHQHAPQAVHAGDQLDDLVPLHVVLVDEDLGLVIIPQGLDVAALGADDRARGLHGDQSPDHDLARLLAQEIALLSVLLHLFELRALGHVVDDAVQRA